MAEPFWVEGFFFLAGILSMGGWFLGPGYWVSKILKLENDWLFHFTLSTALMAGFLSLITPWVALPYWAAVALGIVFLVSLIFEKISFQTVRFPKNTSISLGFTILFSLVFAFTFFYYPDTSFDSVSYHLPFIHSFAEFGTIPFPEIPLNWVDHVHFVSPKSVEMMLGLSEMLVPGIYTLVRLLIVLGAAFLLNRLGQKMGVKDPWVCGALYLGSMSVVLNTLHTVKNFYVESTIFFWIVALLLIFWDKKISTAQTGILGGIFSIAVMGAKINAGVYLFVLVVIAGFYCHKKKAILFCVVGMVLGLGGFALPIIARGVSILNELQITQALSHSTGTPIAMRLTILGESLRRFLPVNTFAWGIGAGILLSLWQKKIHVSVLLVLGALSLFFVSFVVSNLYFLTYFQFAAYYMSGFFGIAIIPLVLFVQRVGEQPKTLWISGKKVERGVIIVLLFLGCISAGQTLLLYQGNYLLSGRYYSDILEKVPNEPSTKLFFMNNINPVTEGLEKAQIVDHTTYPFITGNPCDFWKKEKITHIIYWSSATLQSTQLDGGNPAFYEKALSALQTQQCTILLSDPSMERQIIIAKVRA